MEKQERIQNRPKLDIKKHINGEGISLEYSGEIQIITQPYYQHLVGQADKAGELSKELRDLQIAHREELGRLKREYELELQRLMNQMVEQERKHQKDMARLKASAGRKLSEKERQIQQAQALANRQGKGRPSHLTDEHKKIIRSNLQNLKVFGGVVSIKDLEVYLVRENGYTGGYETVRAYVSEFKPPRGGR